MIKGRKCPVARRGTVGTAALACLMALAARLPAGGDTISDRTWLWGHDADSFEGTDLAERFGPKHVDIPQACFLLGVTNACVIRWKGLPKEPFEEFCRTLSGLKSFGWSAADGDSTQSFAQKSDRVAALAQRFPKLSTVWLDGWFEERSIRRPVRELVALRRRLAELPQRPKLTVVFQSHEFDQDPKSALDACDQVSFWFWKPADVLRADELLSRCRTLVGPDKPILIAITLWDMPGGCEISEELMTRQLDFAERALRSGEAAGLVVHCSPLADCDLRSVQMMKEWMRCKGGVVLPDGPCHCAGPVVIENAQMKLTVGEDAVVRSIIVKKTGEEMISAESSLPLCAVTQERLFNNEIKLACPCRETTCRANRIRREGDRLFVGFELVDYEAEIALREEDAFVGFELVRFVSPNLKRYGGKPTDLDMDWPPVGRIRFLQLAVRDRTKFGDWLNVAWDDRVAVGVLAAEPFTAVGCDRQSDRRTLTAEATAALGLEGAKAALVVSPTSAFLDGVAALETAYGLPQGVSSRRSDAFNASVYWTSDVTLANLDRHLALAKQGGFRMMLIYHTAICDHPGDYLSIGSYAYRPEYSKGDEDVRALLGRIHAAGLRAGFHVLHPFVGMESSYVRPTLDPRINLKRHFTLSRPLDCKSTDLVVEENPTGSPWQNEKCRLLAFGGELFSYESYTKERPYRFTGVTRGAKGTTVVEHPRGQIGGVLDVCEFGGTACYVDQNSSIQDELAAKIARIYNLGFDFLCLDGCEGVSSPYAVHVANAQYRVWKLLEPKPLFTEGAAKAHFAWHHLSGANAFDVFPPEDFKAMIVKWPLREAEMLAQDFSRISFGWWGFWLPGETLKDGRTTIGTQPDMWEFGTSRAAAWDSPTTIQFDPEKVARHPRAKDLMEVMRRWEDVRRRKGLTPEQKAALKSPTRQHHLYLNEKGEYELHEITMLTPEDAAGLRAFLFERNGKRVIAYWHTSGTCDCSLPVGPGGATVVLRAADLRYHETDLPFDCVVKAFGNLLIFD